MSPLGLALLATPRTVQAGNAGAVVSGSASQTSSWPDSNSPVHPSWALRDTKPGVSSAEHLLVSLASLV